eukprot:6782120-Alexandrium_andersonii.AAC.1
MPKAHREKPTPRGEAETRRGAETRARAGRRTECRTTQTHSPTRCNSSPQGPREAHPAPTKAARSAGSRPPRGKPAVRADRDDH